MLAYCLHRFHCIQWTSYPLMVSNLIHLSFLPHIFTVFITNFEFSRKTCRILNFEHLFAFFQLRLPAEKNNKYLIFNIPHVQIDELMKKIWLVNPKIKDLEIMLSLIQFSSKPLKFSFGASWHQSSFCEFVANFLECHKNR